MNDRLLQIRECERKSHEEIYEKAGLFQEGSWLQRPVKTVMDVLPRFDGYEELRVLDLGCGVGRNAIAIAESFKDIDCTVDCVDLLDMAIDKLHTYAGVHKVSQHINGQVVPIEDYEIAEDSYDLVLAVSALEHVESRKVFSDKLEEMERGIKANGILCLIINTSVTEHDKETGKALEPQFEVNMQTEKVLSLLCSIFSGWELVKKTVRKQEYEIARSNGISNLKSDVVTYVARKVA